MPERSNSSTGCPSCSSTAATRRMPSDMNTRSSNRKREGGMMRQTDCLKLTILRISFRSVGAFAPKDCRKGLQQDSQIERKRPVVDIPQILCGHSIEILLAPFDLPQSCKPLRHGKAPRVRRPLDLFGYPDRNRPRSHQAHLPANDVD